MAEVALISNRWKEDIMSSGEEPRPERDVEVEMVAWVREQLEFVIAKAQKSVGPAKREANKVGHAFCLAITGLEDSNDYNRWWDEARDAAVASLAVEEFAVEVESCVLADWVAELATQSGAKAQWLASYHMVHTPKSDHSMNMYVAMQRLSENLSNWVPA